MALSTSAAAIASTANEPPMIVKRRCLRVIACLSARLVFSARYYLQDALRILASWFTFQA
jgi:hypothetical protein